MENNKSKKTNKLCYFKYPPNNYVLLCILYTKGSDKYKLQNSSYLLAEGRVMRYEKKACGQVFLSIIV